MSDNSKGGFRIIVYPSARPAYYFEGNMKRTMKTSFAVFASSTQMQARWDGSNRNARRLAAKKAKQAKKKSDFHTFALERVSCDV